MVKILENHEHQSSATKSERRCMERLYGEIRWEEVNDQVELPKNDVFDRAEAEETCTTNHSMM